MRDFSMGLNWGMLLGCALMVFGLLFGHPAHSATDQATSQFVLCKHEKSVRSLRILPDGNKGGYTVTYSKGGSEEVVGSNRSLSVSETILQGIESKLKATAWSCRQVSKANIATSNEASQ
jgi:hypothetical protein